MGEWRYSDDLEHTLEQEVFEICAENFVICTVEFSIRHRHVTSESG